MSIISVATSTESVPSFSLSPSLLNSGIERSKEKYNARAARGHMSPFLPLPYST